jgi:hypothetical protein
VVFRKTFLPRRIKVLWFTVARVSQKTLPKRFSKQPTKGLNIGTCLKTFLQILFKTFFSYSVYALYYQARISACLSETVVHKRSHKERLVGQSPAELLNGLEQSKHLGLSGALSPTSLEPQSEPKDAQKCLYLTYIFYESFLGPRVLVHQRSICHLTHLTHNIRPSQMQLFRA